MDECVKEWMDAKSTIQLIIVLEVVARKSINSLLSPHRCNFNGEKKTDGDRKACFPLCCDGYVATVSASDYVDSSSDEWIDQ